jgi:hypothetical protein
MPGLGPQVLEPIVKVGVLPPRNEAFLSLLHLEIDDLLLELLEAALQRLDARRVSLVERRQIPFDQVRGVAKAFDLRRIIPAASLRRQRRRQANHHNRNDNLHTPHAALLQATTAASTLPDLSDW